MHEKSIAQLSAGLRAGDYSSVELTQYFLQRIERHDGVLNSFVTVTPESALAAAEAADRQLAGGGAGPCAEACAR